MKQLQYTHNVSYFGETTLKQKRITSNHAARLLKAVGVIWRPPQCLGTSFRLKGSGQMLNFAYKEWRERIHSHLCLGTRHGFRIKHKIMKSYFKSKACIDSFSSVHPVLSYLLHLFRSAEITYVNKVSGRELITSLPNRFGWRHIVNIELLQINHRKDF